MTTIADLVHLQITTSGIPAPAPNFGVPLIACYHALGGPLVQAFSSLTEAETAGIVDSGATKYLHALVAAAFSQDPRPEIVKVGRRAAPWVQVSRWTPVTMTEGVVYEVYLWGALVGTHTVPASATATTIATAIDAIVDGLTSPGIVTTVGSGYVDVTATSGQPVQFEIRGDGVEITCEDRTSATSIAGDLSLFEAADQDWYGLAIDATNKTDILAAAAWLATRRKLGSFVSPDSACGDGGSTTDVMAAAKAAGYLRAHIAYHPQVGSTLGIGHLAGRMTADPGSDTWAFKRVIGTTARPLSTTAANAIRAKFGNYYVDIVMGEPSTLWGYTSGGQYADTIRGIDWLHSEISRAVWRKLATNPKIPYTDAGADTLRAAVFDRLEAGVRVGFLVEGSVDVTATKAAAQADADRAARRFRGIAGRATLAGAIHETDISVSLI